MAFLSGRVTFDRFAVSSGTPPSSFDDSHIETLQSRAVGRALSQVADGVNVGFSAGDHILDLEFKPEKNIIHGCLLFSMRVDSNRVPGDLLRAYTHMELQVLSADNPSGFPSRKQRQQAKELAKERCRAEAESGRFQKMREFPVLWDSLTGFVYFGSASLAAHDLFRPLFREAFGLNLSQVTSGSLASEVARKIERTRALDDLTAMSFTGRKQQIEYVWLPEHSGTRDYLGNEFLLWLWWILETHSETLNLPDATEATCWMSKSLTLECPLGETGKDAITSSSPPRLPEAKKALSVGKMPRQAGLIVVRHDEQYELKLRAETLGITSALLPRIEAESPQARCEERIVQIRHLSQTLDLLYEEFCRQRLGPRWKEQAADVRSWLADREPPAVAVATEAPQDGEVESRATGESIPDDGGPVSDSASPEAPAPSEKPAEAGDPGESLEPAVPPDRFIDSGS